MTTWSDLSSALGPVTIRAEIELPYGRKVTVPLVTLTYHEWVSVGLEVPDPAIPRTLVDKSGNKVPNRDDVGYQRAVQEAASDRNYRRLALAMEKAGITIPGNTSAEKGRTLATTLDAGVAARLIMLLGDAALGGRGRLLDTADTFRRGDDEADEDTESAPLDTD